ncbi:hypothetical protein [Aequorivita xiaoshiensis]|uniref:DUF4252 domain-containing protein n=1 Tax=Aequorivita xiaoshiensis TaxID=2874476 RepID=A0A9X1R4R4_9FLAO|nr:hypothetical protein [Aequorivita xiaoshiensis]MCG2432221.1 hypothetical protein [Aequorivita xiaoshiensis]
MKKTVFLILTLITSNLILAQNRDAEYDEYVSELANVEINELLNYPISNLTENEILLKLKKKTNSELNTLASILLNYKFAETLDLKIEEQTMLQMRMTEMADKFYEKNKFIFLEYSGGYSPTFGIKDEIYNDKKVMILLMGGTCIIDEIAWNEKRLYSIFNERMKKNIAE